MKTALIKFALVAIIACGIGAMAGRSDAASWDKVTIGTISGMTIVDWGFYFWLEGAPQLCSYARSGGTTTGAVSTTSVPSEESRRAMLYLVATAIRTNRTVRIFANDNDTNWACRVGAIGMD
jgi:hypothetical protein